MTTNHTSGPWSLQMDRTPTYALEMAQDHGAVEIHNTAGFPIALIITFDEGDSRGPNARLVAAAPDSHRANIKAMQKIEQLAGMVNDYAQRLGLGKKVNVDDWTDDLKAAIAKATGAV